MTEPLEAKEPVALRAALTYAGRGWPVAPAHSINDDLSCTCGDAKCTSKGKHPLTAHGLKDASTDAKQVREWWTKWPHANVLIRTGMVGDRCLVALDIDPRHNGDESLAKLIVEHGELPETPQCVTGGGGQHIFMWAPRSIPNSAGKAGDGRFGEGVDVRGEGGYVIAAPSKHESGRTYQWDSGAHPADVVLAEAPAWFVHLAGWSKKRLEADGNVHDTTAFIQGGRNDSLMRLAGAMRRVGTGLKRITDALLDENEERCNPPLDPAEVKKIARSAVKYPSGDPSPPGVDTFPAMGWAAIKAELPPVPWLCEGLGIAPGAVTIIGGLGYGGKTITMQAMALAVASGRPIWGQYPCKQGRVVHIDYEQGPRLTRERYQRMARQMGIFDADLEPYLSLISLPKGKLSDPEAEDTLVRLCTGAALMVTDAFRGAFPKAKENDSEARQFLDMLQIVSERTGCTIVVIMHSRKASDDSGDVKSALRGSSALFDAAQTVYMLDGMPNRPTKVHNTKDRLLGESRPTFGILVTDVVTEGLGEPDRRWGLSVEYVSPEDLQIAYESKAGDDNSLAINAERVESAGKRILDLLATAPDGLGVAQLRGLLYSTVRPADLAAALPFLIQSGGVRQEGKGAHAVFHASREPGWEG